MTDKKLKQLLDGVVVMGGHTPAMAGQVLYRDILTDRFVAQLLDVVLASNTDQKTRTEAVCRLLGTYGVGTVVEGRLV